MVLSRAVRSSLKNALRPLAIGAALPGSLFVASGCRGCTTDDKSPGPASITPPVALVRYVNQVQNGKFIAPLAPPALGRQPNSGSALPDLPPLANHGKPPPPPPKAKGEHPCGSARVGDRLVPLDCMDPDYGRIDHATQPLVGYDALHGKDVSLPAVVDHRTDGTEGPVRDQGESPACTAFSMTSAVEHAVNRYVKTPIRLSVMEVWARYHTSNMARADMGNISKSIAQDSDWPYSDRVATSWLSPDLCQTWGLPTSQCGRPVDDSKLATVERRGIAEIDDIARLSDPRDSNAIKMKIAAGQDVWIGLHVGPDFRAARSNVTSRDAPAPATCRITKTTAPPGTL